MAVKTCPNCGYELKTCPSCGHTPMDIKEDWLECSYCGKIESSAIYDGFRYHYSPNFTLSYPPIEGLE